MSGQNKTRHAKGRTNGHSLKRDVRFVRARIAQGELEKVSGL